MIQVRTLTIGNLCLKDQPFKNTRLHSGQVLELQWKWNNVCWTLQQSRKVYTEFIRLFTGADSRAVHALSVPELLRLHVRVVMVPDAVLHSLTSSGGLPDIWRPALRGTESISTHFTPKQQLLSSHCVFYLKIINLTTSQIFLTFVISRSYFSDRRVGRLYIGSDSQFWRWREMNWWRRTWKECSRWVWSQERCWASGELKIKTLLLKHVYYVMWTNNNSKVHWCHESTFLGKSLNVLWIPFCLPAVPMFNSHFFSCSTCRRTCRRVTKLIRTPCSITPSTSSTAPRRWRSKWLHLSTTKLLQNPGEMCWNVQKLRRTLFWEVTSIRRPTMFYSQRFGVVSRWYPMHLSFYLLATSTFQPNFSPKFGCCFN